MKLLVEESGNKYDISGLCTELSLSDSLNNGASCLEFSYIYDGYLAGNGATVTLMEDDGVTGLFSGRLFKVSMSQKRVVQGKAYDQLRYGKTKDTILVENDTVTSLVGKMCASISLKQGECANVEHVLKTRTHTDKTWLDIIYTSILDTLVETQHMYCLRDEFGVVCLRDLESMFLPLILGENSLAYEYSWEKSIDSDFYNQVKLVSENETTGKGDVFKTFDSQSIERYGLLQYYEVIDKNVNKAQAKERADLLLKLYNHEQETISMNCIGDLSIRAGNSFYGKVEELGLNYRLIVNKVTHKFLPIHTMQLEVMRG